MKMLLTHPTRLNPGSWLAGSLLALIAALLSAGQAPAQEPKAQEKEAQERDLRVTAPGRQFTVTARGTTLTRTLIRTATMQWQKALESPVTCLALSPDASLLAAGCREQSLSILHTADGTMVWIQRSPGGIPVALQFSADGSRLTAMFKDGTSRTWDWRQGSSKPPSPPQPKPPSPPNSGLKATSPDGQTTAFADGKQVGLLGNKKGVLLWKQSLGSPAASLAFSPDGGRVAVGCKDSKIYLLSAKNGQVLQILPGAGGVPVTLQFQNARSLRVQTSDGATQTVNLVAPKQNK